MLAVATGSSTNFTLSIGTATRCSPTPRKPPTPITTALMLPLLSVSRSLMDPTFSLLSLYTFRPASFEVRQVPWNDEVSDAVAGAAVVARSVLADDGVCADGLCANAALASMTEAATPATAYLVNISVLLSSYPLRKPVIATSVPPVPRGTRALPCAQKPPQYGGMP